MRSDAVGADGTNPAACFRLLLRAQAHRQPFGRAGRAGCMRGVCCVVRRSTRTRRTHRMNIMFSPWWNPVGGGEGERSGHGPERQTPPSNLSSLAVNHHCQDLRRCATRIVFVAGSETGDKAVPQHAASNRGRRQSAIEVATPRLHRCMSITAASRCWIAESVCAWA